MSKQKVIIIGAGPAGLTAGYKLLQASKEYEVVILEANRVVGGISRTVVHHGKRMDIGGHRFFSKDLSVNAMWQELMPLQGAPARDDRILGRAVSVTPGGPDPEKTDRVMLVRNRVSRIYYQRHFFDYPVKLNFNTIRNMGVMTTLAAGFSYLGRMFRKLPETSLENFYINRFGRKLYSMFFEGYTEKLWGRHPKAISADWGAQRVKGLSLVAVLKDILSKCVPGSRRGKKVETSLIEEFHYPKHGPGQLWEIAAAEFEKLGGRIQYGMTVQEIKVEDGRVREVVAVDETGTASAFACDVVISSMPLKDLIAGMNGVPEEVSAIAAGLPYRDFVTVGILVKRINLKNQTKLATLGNIIPDCWIYVQNTDVKLGRIQVFNNWSPYLLEDPENTVWLGLEYFCAEGDEFWRKSEEEWVRLGAGELVKMGVLAEGEAVLDFHVEKVPKAYPAYFDTYSQIDRLTAPP